MPKYCVTLEEVASYDVIVEAENEDQAAERAEAKFIAEGAAQFPCAVTERDAVNVEDISHQFA